MGKDGYQPKGVDGQGRPPAGGSHVRAGGRVMSKTMNDMGEGDQHQVGIRVKEQKSDGQIVCTGPAQFQPFLVETGQDLCVISCTINETVGECITATMTLHVAEIVMRVDEIPEAVKALHYPGPDKAIPITCSARTVPKFETILAEGEAKPVIERSKVLIETMGHEPEIIEGPGFVERGEGE